ncbi:PREDICTED: uncharacterized protein LOC109229848 [Nicotiana attenuata]|uniref:uncharacterized protein LOC109229848 n=1 Tax=Nicotiana attenuata TaxID=49451 RepID=UPI0009047B8A|nr:PREDICTED: uncharacterized protein LOC109229848 [Nicotiana attenuata]
MEGDLARSSLGISHSLEVSVEATPFSLVYGVEALIRVKVGEPSIRFWYTIEESNYEALNTILELLDERHEVALIRLATQKQRIERYYNRRAILRYFNVGDLVLRKVTLNPRNPNEGKLGPNWVGPYKILEVTGKGSYKLEMMNGEQPIVNDAMKRVEFNSSGIVQKKLRKCKFLQ